jgi:NADH:ubiquinone oxidoreductase subunit 6 (subunit J)
MNWPHLSPTQLAGGQIALAAVLAVAGFVFLLPRPQGRRVTAGVAALIAAAAVFAAYLYATFGNPMPDAVGSVLFWVFAGGALVFGTVLVTQSNPARGAIAFAFVILSTCGLFLLLAATFLMAVTIIVYAGAIIVTFLFVLMLSQAKGPSNENDRSREPLLGGLAGFAFTGLVLFSIYLSAIQNSASAAESGDPAAQPLPAAVLTAEERQQLLDLVARLDTLSELLGDSLTPPAGLDEKYEVTDPFDQVQRERVLRHVEDSIRKRVAALRPDPQGQAVLARAEAAVRQQDRAFRTVDQSVFAGSPPPREARAEVRKLRDEVLLLATSTQLPLRNVTNIGYTLYTTHLLAVELAGTLLLVATIGAIAIAQRRRAAE